MVGFQQLREAQPEQVRQAGQKWVEWANRFQDRAIDFKKKIYEHLDDEGVWTGKAGDAARGHCDRLQTVMYEHVDEPADIGKALRHAAEDIETQQKRLAAVVSEIEAKKDKRWRVDANGGVYGPEGEPHAIRRYQDEVDGIVEVADEADQDCARKIQAAIEKIGDVDTYVKQELKEGRRAAEKLQWYLRNGKEPPEWLKDQLRANADDEYFAASFGNKLGAKGILGLPAALGDIGMNEDDLKGLMSSVGELVGTATNDETLNRFNAERVANLREQLVEAAGSTETVTVGDPGPRSNEGYEFRKFWAVQKLLQFGEGHIEGEFLADVAGEIYENRDDLPGGGWHNRGQYGFESGEWGDGLSGEDPMITALEALDDSPAAGRMFFSDDSDGGGGELDRVSTLMDEYYKDPTGGPALTEALKAASTEFSHVDPDRSSDAHEDAGAIASNFLHEAAEAEREFDWGDRTPPEIKRDLSSVMSYYYEDLNAALMDPAGPEELPIGAYDWDGDSVFGFEHGAAIQLDDAKTLLDTVWEDETSRERVLGAATVYANENIQYKMDHWDDQGSGYSSPEEARNAGYKDYGTGLGRLMGAAHEGEIADAEQTAAVKDLSKAVLSVGVAATGPLGAGASVGAAALGAIAGGAIDQIGGDAREQYAAAVDDTASASRATVTEMMLRRGDWPPETLPPEHRGYWDPEAQHLRMPQDPQERRDFAVWLTKNTDGHIKQAHNDFMIGLQTGVGKYGSP